jgi:phosphoglycerate kinase
MKTLDKLNLSGKRVLLRVGFNSDVFKGKVIESPRIKASVKTIKELVKKKAKVVLISHQGRPGKKDFVSLKQHAKFLNKYVKAKFVNDTIGKKAIKSIKNLKKGEVLLLENTRFLKDEFKPSLKNKFVKNLNPLFDYYVNDAFSVSHRNQTSIVSFPKVLPNGIGRVMEEELRNIKKLKSKMKNCLFILGGRKSKDLIPLLAHKKILAGGRLSLLALISKGHKLGEENKNLRKEFSLLPSIKRHSRNIELPLDLAIEVNGKRKVLDLKDFPQNHSVLDIGDRTIEMYKKEIKKAKVIFFKGSMGVFEDKNFSKGTKEILKAISESKTFSIIAGGQSSDALKKFKINPKKFSYVSLSGGALVEYLVEGKLRGLTAQGSH